MDPSEPKATPRAPEGTVIHAPLSMTDLGVEEHPELPTVTSQAPAPSKTSNHHQAISPAVIAPSHSFKSLHEITPATAPPTIPTLASLPTVVDVRDPDEDDLDDLDELLDDFSVTKTAADPVAPSSSTPSLPTAATPPPLPELDSIIDDEFTKELQAGMANLLGNFDTSPELQAQFENLVKELGSAAALSDVPTTPLIPSSPSISNDKSTSSTSKADVDFQSTIRATMDRISSSSTAATAAAASSSTSVHPSSNTTDDLLATMLSQIGNSAQPGAPGSGSEDDLSKLLFTMMAQLTNKEILYEPMLELHQKYPDWLTAHETTTKKQDLDRYRVQQKLVSEIVARFEAPGYSDDRESDRDFIVERMQKMQEMGSPPEDLVGGLIGGALPGMPGAGGSDAAADPLAGLDQEGCAQQ